MAEVLDTFKFGSQHPWDEWLDGSIRRLRNGTDFESSPMLFRSQIYQNAKKRGVKVRVHLEGEESLVMQVYEDAWYRDGEDA